MPPPSVKKDEIVISGDRDPVAVAVQRLTEIYNDKVAATYYCLHLSCVQFHGVFWFFYEYNPVSSVMYAGSRGKIFTCI